MRLTDLRVFYSDAGVLPRVDLLGRVVTGSTPWQVSLHMVSGLWGVQLLLLGVAAFCAVCLLIGHRTRLFTFLSWVLLVSLHNRNLTILNAGDLLFRVLLFWSLFLPLGARCSVDAAMKEPAGTGPGKKRNDRIWSVPAFCLMAQVTPRLLGDGAAEEPPGLDRGRDRGLVRPQARLHGPASRSPVARPAGQDCSRP